ncbi:hypothetical protein KP509_05G059800 [Ceratopteris richardii]|uniref:AT-hook motif nuclear-localized protein n=1 Tax=Ceratopteris richardii TaxID=49495 RepID=A0A8T2UTG1_CERRI|nr:hypothetical protein KP509_05G059800 [Ceratopteris richardii]
MEGRDSMSMSPVGGMTPSSNSFGTILQKGFVMSPGSNSPAMPASPMPPPGLHAPAPVRPVSGVSVGSLNNPNPSQIQYIPGMVSSSMNPHHISVSLQMTGAAGRMEPVFKRKRGRPRKYGPDGSMALALISHPTVGNTASPIPKRGRGRPPGSGRKQQLEALGTAGIGFTPHIITVAAGEDVAMKIMSFSHQGARAICILSANGAISNVTLRQSAISGGSATYEGRFEILSLSGSFLPEENNGIHSRTGGLSVSLAGPDGRVIGGGVAGLLVAAGPVQVVVGSFMCGGKKSKQTGSDAALSSHCHDAQAIQSPVSEPLPTKFYVPSTSGAATPNMPAAFQLVGWPSSNHAMSVDARRNTDINIPLPGSS